MHLRKQSDSRISLDMTPMIDVVFQLLAFFLLTFRVFALEGDFNVKMPLGGAPAPQSVPTPALHVRLTALPGGELAGIAVNGSAVESFAALHARVVNLVADERGPGGAAELPEVELDCDSQLGYRYVIDAVTAVSGRVDEQGQTIKLLDKIRFAPPRAL
jgi:biopolymer transport protein ExbD